LDEPHAVITGTTPYFAHRDGLGNVIALTDSATPSVLRSYDYDAWGGLVWGDDFKPFANADRARFKGALWLGPEVDVYYMRARWYEPKAGRFLSEDPLGLEGGINPYVFAGDDPVNNADPTGRDYVTNSGYCPPGYELRKVEEEEAWCVRDPIPWGLQELQQALASVNAWSTIQAQLSRECKGGFTGSRCTALLDAMSWLERHDKRTCKLMGATARRVYEHGNLRYEPTLTAPGDWNYITRVIRLGPGAFVPGEPRETVITLGHEAWHEYINGGNNAQAERVGQYCARGYH
ncbi:MAG TPA: RHS repeat-associated core domain-containing protein, partial [Pyrinomonadaceae bacterium]|nr:RHS repeat-associated core domain-containing protein [Pyrinomonadaceae bacterium]